MHRSVPDFWAVLAHGEIARELQRGLLGEHAGSPRLGGDALGGVQCSGRLKEPAPGLLIGWLPSETSYYGCLEQVAWCSLTELCPSLTEVSGGPWAPGPSVWAERGRLQEGPSPPLLAGPLVGLF
ncbi:unnamed protein product [Gadus morhua 'NCC']